MFKARQLKQVWFRLSSLFSIAVVFSLLMANTEISYALSAPLPALKVGTNQTAPARQANQPALSGTFYMISGGPKPYFYLLDDQGQNTELFIDEAVLAAGGGATALNRHRVTLTGKTLGVSRTLNGGSVWQVSDIQLATTPGKNSPTTQVVTGSRPFINILCRFSDSPNTTPQPPSFFTGLMSNTRPGLDNYFRESSLGAIDLVGTQVVGWFNLPQPLSYYFTADPPNFLRMASDCSALADSAVNFNDYQGINFIFNVNFGCCAWGGSIGLNLDGTYKAWPATWMPPGGFFQSIFAHEMGHAFGMPHSANVLGTTYANAWDVMSQDRYNCAADTSPTYGCVGQHSIAYHKDIPGWIPANRKLVTAPEGGSYNITLERLAQPGSTGYLMAKIPIAGSPRRYYTVEARYKVGYDTKVSNNAVIIHQVDTSRLDDAWIMDSDGNSNSSDAGAQWTVGETFNDAANGISISVDSATASGFVVTINVAPPPVLTLNAAPMASSVITNGDVNWFKVVAPVATYYTFETFGGSLTDTVMKLYGPGDTTTLVAQNDDYAGNPMAKINRQFLAPGTYYVAVNSKLYTTGNYTLSAVAPLLVTRNQDVQGQLGSLSYAVAQALPNDTVIFMLTGSNQIQLRQSLLLNKNITLQGQCNNNQPVIKLDGSGTPAGTDGLVVSSQVILDGVAVSGFPGRQLVVNAGGSKFSCTRFG